MLKYLRSILLKSLGETVKCHLKLFNIVWISTTFMKIDESLENYFTIFNESSQYSQSFSWSKTFGFYKISYRIASFMTKISCFTRILQLLKERCKFKKKILVNSWQNSYRENRRKTVNGVWTIFSSSIFVN